jgi:uncharacterized protein (DUF1330 family)
VRGGEIDTHEGDGPKGGMVVIEFDGREQATSRVYIVERTVTPPKH